MAVSAELHELTALLKVLVQAARPKPGSVLLVLEPSGQTTALNVLPDGEVEVVPSGEAMPELLMVAKGTIEGLSAIFDGSFETAIQKGALTVQAKRAFLKQLVAPKTRTAVDIRCAR